MYHSEELDIPPCPKGFGEIARQDEFSGIIEEDILREKIAELDGDDEQRRSSLRYLQGCIYNNSMLSDLLMIDGSIDALARAREKEDFDGRTPNSKGIKADVPRRPPEHHMADVLIHLMEKRMFGPSHLNEMVRTTFKNRAAQGLPDLPNQPVDGLAPGQWGVSEAGARLEPIPWMDPPGIGPEVAGKHRNAHPLASKAY